MILNNTLRRALPSLAALALALTAAACSDVVQPVPAEAGPAADRSNLASAAVASLVTSRGGGFQIVIPDETRTESQAIVLYLHGGVTDRYRFVRRAGGWEMDQHLERSADPAMRGPLLDRATPGTSTFVPNGTPPFALTTFSRFDGTDVRHVTLYPVRYVYGDFTTTTAYRWTQSADVVSGYEDPDRQPREAAFQFAGTQWRTADSVFTVDGYHKWVFGHSTYTSRECIVPSENPTAICSADGLLMGLSPRWADAYYHIRVETRNPSAVSVSPTALVVVPGQPGQQLTATVRDQYGVNMTAPVTWSSSNPAVATVSSTGLVTAVAFGSAVITATTTGGASATATTQSNASVTLSGPASIWEGWTTATASVAPAGSYYYTWTYDRCDYRETQYKCVFGQSLPGGLNVTTAQIYVSKYDAFVRYRVSVKPTSTSSSVGSAELKVNGGNQIFQGTVCSGGRRVC